LLLRLRFRFFPLTRYAGLPIGGTLAAFRLALGTSETPVADLEARGLTPHDQQQCFDALHEVLLAAGIQVIYGGRLQPDVPSNYTHRLLDMARTQCTERLVLNVAPWPLWTTYTDAELAQVGDCAEVRRHPRPDLPVDDLMLEATETGFVPPKSALQRYAWARSLTSMREWVTAHADARILLGGRVEGYTGRLAGIVEEAVLSLRASQPLFLLGGFGGSAAVVLDLLKGVARPEMTTAAARTNVLHHDALVSLYAEHGGEWLLREDVAEELRGLGQQGLAAVLRNGLDEGENQELSRTTNPQRMGELVQTGMDRLA